jgi:hypothetical protein
MLLNIVRSRYLEVPVFLTVSSVLTQYEYDSSLGLSGVFQIGTGTTDTITGDTNLRFSERPTITYLPVEGQEFSAHLLSDIPSELIFAAAQAGWPIDVFMRIGIQRLGAAENMSFGEVPATGYIDTKMQFESDAKKLEGFERMINFSFSKCCVMKVCGGSAAAGYREDEIVGCTLCTNNRCVQRTLPQEQLVVHSINQHNGCSGKVLVEGFGTKMCRVHSMHQHNGTYNAPYSTQATKLR